MTVDRARQAMGEAGATLSAREIETAIEQAQRYARLVLELILRRDLKAPGRRGARAS